MEKNLTIDRKWVMDQRRQGLDDGQIARKLGLTKDVFLDAIMGNEKPTEKVEIKTEPERDIPEENPVRGTGSYVPEDVITPKKEKRNRHKSDRSKNVEPEGEVNIGTADDEWLKDEPDDILEDVWDLNES